MKYFTIYLGENRIEIFNSLIGKETIKVNGEIVSSKFSLTGTEHHFKLTEYDKESDYKIITGFGINGVVIDLYINDKPIIESSKSSCLGFLLTVIFVSLLIALLQRLF